MGMGQAHPGASEYHAGQINGRFQSMQEVCRETRTRFDERFDRMEEKLDELARNVWILKAKSAAYGGAAGAVIMGVTQIILHLVREG